MYWLENESILSNSGWVPQYLLDGQKTANVLIKIFQSRYPHLKDMIKPELDSCQVELINPKPHVSLESAGREITEWLYRVHYIAKELWLLVSQQVAPKSNAPYLTSDAFLPEITERYQKIGEILEWYGVRSSTNIAWLHVNIWHENNEYILKIHKKISQIIHDMLVIKNMEWLGMHPERFFHYANVTNSLGWNYLPFLFDDEREYIDNDWNPHQQWHTFVRLKKYWPHLVTELRTPDAGTSPEDLYHKVKQQELFLKDIL